MVDSASKGIANVLVFARKTTRVHDSHQQAVKDDVVFDQKECVFLAHVLPVRVGQTVLIKNSDPIGHNTNITTQADVNINPPNESFEIANLPAGEEIEFQAWHERGSGAQGAFEVKKDWPKGRFKLKLKAGEEKDLGDIKVNPKAFK